MSDAGHFTVVAHIFDPSTKLTAEEMEFRVLALFAAHMDASLSVAVMGGKPDANLNQVEPRFDIEPDAEGKG